MCFSFSFLRDPAGRAKITPRMVRLVLSASCSKVGWQQQECRGVQQESGGQSEI